MSYGSPPPPPEYGAPDPNQQPPYGQQYPAYGQGGQPPGYGGYGAPGGYQSPQTSVMAIISLIAGIVSIILACCCWPLSLVGIAAIVLGILAKKEIAASNGLKTGDGLALAGLITGIAGIFLGIAGFVLAVIFGAFDYGYY